MIELLDLRTFINYVKAWADPDQDLKYFQYGGIERGLAFARGHEDFAYPFAWLEQPVIVSEDNEMGNTNEEFVCGLSVLYNYDGSEHEAYIDAQANALKILYRFQKKMRHDVNDGKIVTTIRGMKKEPVSDLWIDKHAGYRLEFRLSLNANRLLC
jgi:hypothetical protein